MTQEESVSTPEHPHCVYHQCAMVALPRKEWKDMGKGLFARMDLIVDDAECVFPMGPENTAFRGEDTYACPQCFPSIG